MEKQQPSREDSSIETLLATIWQKGAYGNFQAETDTLALIAAVGTFIEFLVFVYFPLEFGPSWTTRMGRRKYTRLVV